ncbi:hypothetical protein [Chondromyces apiculatus]|uniref:Uncharacterized protein n=1 Tax=Chondromyces apiculatus DSM 436 TaxID=1192034 RepID=A0A017TBV4_9BACT|nr:hypothetical protein [Chondromyces apiculatus]EYF06402.1 Hypothetical protein CAP_1932 [Chondromyces apiculatus DSM 436]
MRYDRTVIAYHGCDTKVAERILAGAPFQKSKNSYDWLGEGIYFWEFGNDRALKFAHFQKSLRKVKHPAVVGAIVQLGKCFDLMDTRYTAELSEAYHLFKEVKRAAHEPLPKNKGKTPEKKLRHRDCAVLNFYLQRLEERAFAFDTVRCAFVEGPRAFPGSGIQHESHIQISVRNPSCILGGVQAHDGEAMSRKSAKKKALPKPENLDAETRARRQVLAEMREMTPQQLFELAVRAGIYTKDGKLTPPYRDDAPPSACRPTD